MVTSVPQATTASPMKTGTTQRMPDKGTHPNGPRLRNDGGTESQAHFLVRKARHIQIGTKDATLIAGPHARDEECLVLGAAERDVRDVLRLADGHTADHGARGRQDDDTLAGGGIEIPRAVDAESVGPAGEARDAHSGARRDAAV